MEDDYEGDYFQEEEEFAFKNRTKPQQGESAFEKSLRLQRQKDDEEEENLALQSKKTSRINYSALDEFLGTTFTKPTPKAITQGAKMSDLLTDAEKESLRPKYKRTLKFAPNVKKGSVRAKDRKRQAKEVKAKPPVWDNPEWEKAHKELQKEFAPLGGERPPMTQKELREFKRVEADEPSVPQQKEEKITYNITDEDITAFAGLKAPKSEYDTDYDEDTEEDEVGETIYDEEGFLVQFEGEVPTTPPPPPEIDDPLIPEITKFDRPPPLVLPDELDVFDPNLVDSPLGESPDLDPNYNPQLADYRAFQDRSIPDIQQRFIDASYDEGVNPFAPGSPTWMGKLATTPTFDFKDAPKKLGGLLGEGSADYKYEEIKSPDYVPTPDDRFDDLGNYIPREGEFDLHNESLRREADRSPSPSPPPSPPPKPSKSKPKPRSASPPPKKSPSPEPRDDERLARIIEVERRRRKLVKERKAQRKKEKAQRRESPSPEPRRVEKQRSPSPKGERDERSDKGEHHNWKDGREKTATYKRNKAKGVNWSEVRCRGGTCWDTIDRSNDYKGRGAYKRNKSSGHYKRQLRGKDDKRKNN